MPIQFTENPQRNRSINFSATSRAHITAPGLREATQAEAEAGTSLGKYMSPLRVAQAIDVFAAEVPELAHPGDIRNYGAAEGGVFDNYTAITAALAANEVVYIPPGTWAFGTQILPPAGRTIYGDGEGISILAALSHTHNGILISGVDNVTVRDLTLDGVYNAAGTTGGLALENANYCHVDDVTIDGWSAQGLALRFATYNQIGRVTTINNGHRGVNLSALSHHNTFGEIIATGNKLAAFLIGYGCYKNNITSVIGGNHENSAIWVNQDCYENVFGSVNIAAPASGFEDNAAIVIGWHAYRNHIGNAIVRGWRRGIQYKALDIVASGDGDIDPFMTEGNTSYNTVGFAYIETDDGADAACVYYDSADTRIVEYNRIGFIHGKDATYGVWDTIGDSENNSFGDQTWDNVTTPFSLAELGSNLGLYRSTNNYLGIDCQSPAGALHVRRSVTGDHSIVGENSNTAATTNKTVSFQAYMRSTAAAQVVGGGLHFLPSDNDVAGTYAEIRVRSASSTAAKFRVYGDGSIELPVAASDPTSGAGRLYGNSSTQTPKYHDGTAWRTLAALGLNNTWTGTNTFESTVNINAATPQLNIRDTTSPGVAGTICATINLRAYNDAGTPVDTALAQMNGYAASVTAGSESGAYRFATRQSGTLANRFIIGDGVTVGNEGVSDQGAGTINISADYYRGGTKVVGARDTGWTAMTGTPDESTAYDTASVTLPQLAGRVAALQVALTTHGLIGA
jgi:hypothetical protein